MVKIRQQKRQDLRDFLRFWLPQMGITTFKVGRDFLYIGKHPQRGRILVSLKEMFPQYNFYWETSRIIVWF